MTEQLEYQYGTPESDIAAIARRLNSCLGLSFELGDSSHYDVIYHDKSRRFEELILYFNVDPGYRSSSDPPEEYWFEPDDRDCATLLVIFAPAEKVREFDDLFSTLFPEFILLKTTTISD